MPRLSGQEPPHIRRRSGGDDPRRRCRASPAEGGPARWTGRTSTATKLHSVPPKPSAPAEGWRYPSMFMSNQSPLLRFALAVDGNRSSYWRLRAGMVKPELFLEREGFGNRDDWHLSFHASGKWHLKSHGTQQVHWDRPDEAVPGYTHALDIVQPRAVVYREDPAAPDVVLTPYVSGATSWCLASTWSGVVRISPAGQGWTPAWPSSGVCPLSSGPEHAVSSPTPANSRQARPHAKSIRRQRESGGRPTSPDAPDWGRMQTHTHGGTAGARNELRHDGALTSSESPLVVIYFRSLHPTSGPRARWPVRVGDGSQTGSLMPGTVRTAPAQPGHRCPLSGLATDASGRDRRRVGTYGSEG
jgi:hypothetical protein